MFVHFFLDSFVFDFDQNRAEFTVLVTETRPDDWVELFF
jgi:hypothetical protein